MVALGEIAEIVSGGTPKTTVDEYWDGDIPWATPKDLSKLPGAYISETPRNLTSHGMTNSSATLLPAYSVLLSSRAPIGHVAINQVPMATNQGFKNLVPREDASHSKFLFHWLRANRSYLEGLGNGATFKELSKATISKVEVPLPPLPEQRRIAAILDHADALRTKRRETLAHLDELPQAIFLDMFGDTESHANTIGTAPLSDLVPAGDRINYGVVQPGEDLPGGVALVRAGDLRDGRIRTSGLRYISSEVDDKHRRSRLVGDEILISCVGSIGEIALADESVRGFNIARAVARVRVDRRADRQYVATYLTLPRVQRYFVAELRTVAQPTLNIRQIAEVEVPLPPLSLQREFSRRVSEVEALRIYHCTALAELDALFASLQSRAFRGEL